MFFIIRFICFFLFVCFAFHFLCSVSVLFCVLFLFMHIVVSFLFVYKFTDHYNRVENPVTVNKYQILSERRHFLLANDPNANRCKKLRFQVHTEL